MTNRAAAALLGQLPLLAVLATPRVALAHGGVTGVQDVVQDYGVFIFLIAVVLIGAGVLAWVMLSPQTDESADPPETPGG